MKIDKIIRVAGSVLKWSSGGLAAVSLIFVANLIKDTVAIERDAILYSAWALLIMPLAFFAFSGHQFSRSGGALNELVLEPVRKGWSPLRRTLSERMFDFVFVFAVVKFLLTGGAGMAAYSLLPAVYALLAIGLVARLASRSVPKGGGLLLSVGLLTLVAADVFATPVRVFVDGSLYRYRAGWDETALLATAMHVTVLYVALIGFASRFRPAKTVTAS